MTTVFARIEQKRNECLYRDENENKKYFSQIVFSGYIVQGISNEFDI